MSRRKAAQSPQSDSAPGPNPAVLSAAAVARLLTAAGAKDATEANVAADVAAGAPTNGDGTINLLHYTAWLARAA